MIPVGIQIASVACSWVPLLGGTDLTGLVLQPGQVIGFFALGFGLLWALVNFYLFYPLVQTTIQRLGGSVRTRLGDAAGQGVRGDGGAETGHGTARGSLPEPTIDVLIPAYEEAPVIEQSIANVREARYPQDRISVTVLLEPEDEETPDALERLAPYYDFDVVTVPSRYPGQQGKPRALDYGFELTEGDIVGVIDAEDIVDPGLFREVTLGIVEEGHTVVQGRLDTVNEDDGWLNTVFRGEFGMWFDYLLPAFTRVGYPVPLAGTTCFFRRSALLAMGVKREERFGPEWSKSDELWGRGRGLFGYTPWSVSNVTEDFELGLFLWLDGHSVGYLDSTTAQESPVRLNNWIRQRTRWEKGKLFTFFQYRRQPTPDVRSRAHLLFLSGLPLLGPVNILGVVLVFLVGNAVSYAPGSIIWWVLSLGLTFLVAQSTLYGLGYWTATDKPLGTRLRRTVVTAVTAPVYWILQWGAVLRAMGQLYNGWLGWERTTHNGRNGDGRAEALARPDPSVVDLTRNQRVLALVTILGVAIGLRAAAVLSWPLWNDEIYSIAVRGVQSTTDLLVVAGEPHPPLYFLLLHWWMDVFGQQPIAARALSVVLAAGSIVGIYLLGRELFDEGTGLIGAFLLGVSTFHVHLGSMARMYELLTLLAVFSWLGFTRLETESVRATVSYILATVAMLYTHLVGLIVLLAQYLYFTLSDRHGGITFRRWGRIQAVVAILAIPLTAVYWRQFAGEISADRGVIGWIPAPSTDALVRTVLGYVGYPSHYPILGGSALTYVIAFVVLLVVAGALVLAIASAHPSYGFVLTAGDGTAQMAVLFVVSLLGPFFISHLVTPVYAPRYTATASVALLLLVADGVTNLPRRKLQVAALALLAISSGFFIGGYLTGDSVEPWGETTDYLEANVDDGDVILVQPGWIHSSVAYYYDGQPVDIIRVDDSADLANAGYDPPPSGSRMWVVQFGTETGNVGSEYVGTHRREGSKRFGRITVYRYEPVPGDT